jgi:hypothetical protein
MKRGLKGEHRRDGVVGKDGDGERWMDLTGMHTLCLLLANMPIP